MAYEALENQTATILTDILCGSLDSLPIHTHTCSTAKAASRDSTRAFSTPRLSRHAASSTFDDDREAAVAAASALLSTRAEEAAC